jgi:hypothetical protein
MSSIYSHSRITALKRCERFHYYKVYGSAGGWKRDAPPGARQAYTLSKLETVHMRLGTSLHSAATRIASAIRAGEPTPSHDELLAFVRSELNRVWLSSRDRDAFLDNPGANPCYQHMYYDEEMPREEIERFQQRIQRSVHNLVNAEVWNQVRAADPSDIIIRPQFDSIEFEDVTVYSTIDLMYGVRRNGSLEYTILDWKLQSDSAAMDQVAQYAWFALQSGFAPEFNGECRGQIVRLNDGMDYAIDITMDDIREAEVRLRAGLANLSRFVIGGDLAANIPLPKQHFALRPNTQHCRFCQFYEMCAPDIEQASYKGPFDPEGDHTNA